MNEEQHVMLYGELEPDTTLHRRVLHDLVGTLIAVINVYGDMWRSPTQLLTWPKDELGDIEPVLANSERALLKAERALGKDDGEYYRAVASAIGYYRDALRMCRSLAKHCDHEHLHNFVRAAQRAVDKLSAPAMFSSAADGDPEELEKATLSACKQMRKRFGDQLRDHAVSFDPPVVAEQYTYQPDGE